MATPDEVRREILNFLDGNGEPWAWDDFISTSLVDPYLNAIRIICRDLPEMFPPDPEADSYCNSEGHAALKAIAECLLP